MGYDYSVLIKKMPHPIEKRHTKEESIIARRSSVASVCCHSVGATGVNAFSSSKRLGNKPLEKKCSETIDGLSVSHCKRYAFLASILKIASRNTVGSCVLHWFLKSNMTTVALPVVVTLPIFLLTT